MKICVPIKDMTKAIQVVSGYGIHKIDQDSDDHLRFSFWAIHRWHEGLASRGTYVKICGEVAAAEDGYVVTARAVPLFDLICSVIIALSSALCGMLLEKTMGLWIFAGIVILFVCLEAFLSGRRTLRIFREKLTRDAPRF